MHSYEFNFFYCRGHEFFCISRPPYPSRVQTGDGVLTPLILNVSVLTEFTLCGTGGSSVYKYQLKEIPKHILENISISSTNIREAILHGDIITADTLLGYEFFFSGTVVHGNKLGRKLGYPTANLKVEDEEKIFPGNGIYAVYVEVGPFDQLNTVRYKGMMSIGFRPTVDGKTRVIEVNLFDFDKEIYGQTLKVFVKKYLREEVKYDHLEELVKQIGQDKINSLSVL